MVNWKSYINKARKTRDKARRNLEIAERVSKNCGLLRKLSDWEIRVINIGPEWICLDTSYEAFRNPPPPHKRQKENDWIHESFSLALAMGGTSGGLEVSKKVCDLTKEYLGISGKDFSPNSNHYKNLIKQILEQKGEKGTRRMDSYCAMKERFKRKFEQFWYKIGKRTLLEQEYVFVRDSSSEDIVKRWSMKGSW